MCRYCDIDPGLHSFHIKNITRDHVWYHTVVREARDKNVNQIVEHIEEFLLKKPPGMTWEWSMDCRGFKIEGYTFELTMALQRLIRKYHLTITRFRLTHVNALMRLFVSICKPFLDVSVRQVLVVDAGDSLSVPVAIPLLDPRSDVLSDLSTQRE